MSRGAVVGGGPLLLECFAGDAFAFGVIGSTCKDLFAAGVVVLPVVESVAVGFGGPEAFFDELARGGGGAVHLDDAGGNGAVGELS
jgi:hypothetical protein